MGSVVGEELMHLDAHEEKILVSVRLRPLNEKEIARNDLSDWECVNNTTLIFKNNLPERSMLPTAYTFDRVFRSDCSTKQVYEEGAKEVALSCIGGINSSIFAYGQTSSGKTYTMLGVTEYAVADIYDYIHKHNDREFVLKFSAMEIYNESVRDLLSTDSTPLRLLDDPERGTVVERLIEETLRDWSHLKELLYICEAQRQIGETSLNEVSSRSHQILRLTIESSAREFWDAESSSTLTATVNFVDLAGSERASQTLSAGARLKEGCHINRSLLTLGTVIRKLSKGRNGHVPYRDSKLTRILQNSLGGNARTAIICTMCPAHSHVEQSRNTLLFASCAKEVSTNAQVNVVMSEKALVKQLQRELARLEAELRSLGSSPATSNSAALLKQKEVLIEKMDKEIKELTQQRDIAQIRIKDLLRSSGEYQISKPWAEPDNLLDPNFENTWLCEYSASESSEVVDPLRPEAASHISNKLPDNSEDNFLIDNNSPRLLIDKFFGPNHDEDSEDHCKEVRCIEMEEPKIERNMISDPISSPHKGDRDSIHVADLTYAALKKKIKDMQKTIDCLANPYPVEQSPSSSEAGMSCSRSVGLSRSRSCKAILTTIHSPPWFDRGEKNEYTLPNGSEKEFPGRPEGIQRKRSESDFGANTGELYPKYFETPVKYASIDETDKNTLVSGGLDIASVRTCDSGLDELVKSNSQDQVSDDLIQEAEQETDESKNIVKEGPSDHLQDIQQSPSSWPLEFQKQMREIIELWDVCSVPLVHRTYFFLLFKGDPSDSVYLEVELRRLAFLKNTLSRGNNSVSDGQILTPASSKKAVNRERELLGKQILKRFSAKEREGLYQKWGISLNTKQRRLQLSRRLWTDTKDMDHIKESAALVAKLVGFAEAGQAPKEMFGLSFSLRPTNIRSFSWKHSKSSLL